MRVAIVGSGGREHAIAVSVSKSKRVDKIFALPGNAGIAELAECVPISVMEFDKIAKFCIDEKIDLCINLEQWADGKIYDRIGLDNETVEILGIKVPMITIPVRPGRNLAIIIEIAAMNNRQKKMGVNTAEEFQERLMSRFNPQK